MVPWGQSVSCEPVLVECGFLRMLLWEQGLHQTSYSTYNPTRPPPSATEGPFQNHQSLSALRVSFAPSLPPGATTIWWLQLLPMACQRIGHVNWVTHHRSTHLRGLVAPLLMSTVRVVTRFHHRSTHLRSLVAPLLMSTVRVVTGFGNLSRTLVANSSDCFLLAGRESVAEHIIVLLRHTPNLLQQPCSRHSIAVNKSPLCQKFEPNFETLQIRLAPKLVQQIIRCTAAVQVMAVDWSTYLVCPIPHILHSAAVWNLLPTQEGWCESWRVEGQGKSRRGRGKFLVAMACWVGHKRLTFIVAYPPIKVEKLPLFGYFSY